MPRLTTYALAIIFEIVVRCVGLKQNFVKWKVRYKLSNKKLEMFTISCRAFGKWRTTWRTTTASPAKTGENPDRKFILYHIGPTNMDFFEPPTADSGVACQLRE